MKNVRNRKNEDCMEINFNEILTDKPTETVHTLSLQDKKSICILTFLYVLQGIPLGLAGSVPYILQSRLISYSTQAAFSFVFWPFSLKIFWAPIVDSFYIKSFGRRKTWLIPVQFLIGITMILCSYSVSSWIDDVNNVKIVPMTCAFFFLNFLAATQDIAVDGWALTMLSRSSVGWASTCNSVGQTFGYITAFIVFLSLESATFCNTWLRYEPQETGMVTFSGFLYFWGVVFLVTTTLVWIFKTEENNFDPVKADGDSENKEKELGVVETYQTLWKIINLKPILIYATALFIIKFGFSACDSVTGLKLMEKGVSKEKLAFIGTLVVPIQIMLALLVSKYTTGPAPLNIFIYSSIPRLLFGILFALIVYVTPTFQLPDGSYPFNFYVWIAIGYILHQLLVYPMFVSVMAFYARISDPVIGGTYMTFLNTITNLAGNVPNTFMLYMVDRLTTKKCIGGVNNGANCNTKLELQECTKPSDNIAGVCETILDGYYLEIGFCTIIGLLGILFCKRQLHRLQNMPIQCWHISTKTPR